MKTAPQVVRSRRTKVFHGIYADGEWAVTPAPHSFLNLVQRQHKAVFHYRVTLFCSNWKQSKRKWFNRKAAEFKHLMTGLMVIFNEVVGLHLHQWNWKYLSSFILEALDPIKRHYCCGDRFRHGGHTYSHLYKLLSKIRIHWMEQNKLSDKTGWITATVTKNLPELSERLVLLSVTKLPAFLLWLGFISLASSVFPQTEKSG